MEEFINIIKQRQAYLDKEIEYCSLFEDTLEQRDNLMAAYNELSDLVDYLNFRDTYENRKYYLEPTPQLKEKLEQYNIK